MAAGSTIYNFEIALSDSMRDVYEQISLRVAQHSSETVEYLICRVLAFCLEYTEGLEFSKGLGDPDTPAIWARDLTGTLTHWVEIGSPSVEKLHKASKSVERVVIYTHKSPALILEQLTGQDIYHAEKIELHAFDPKFLTEVSQLTERRNAWSLSVSEKTLYLDIGSRNYVSTVISHALKA